MKIVLQRVSKASVRVENVQTGAIENGLMLLVGIHEDDDQQHMEWLAEKILKLRVFDDKSGKMNLSVQDVKGEILVVPQFTLYADYEQGNRPSYFSAAGPEKAEKLYNEMVSYFKQQSELNIETGKFGANMDVEFCNDGPVTLVLEK
ncbi:D-tyrosyl-tRNA(Tyr) deacylase [Fodinibius salinus]|uniref:D-aminoacyl-tRNA deacylase n=1 Tax=Fodinibius salinus TaxID=860790 RepID=A0A5D3YM07_9BACT|nr:D-aminoacyl-tRNA deacylase [Fodinibius salinus]TYP93711.1 D-tyrosyl-tRNA(Tyr) deacylase [Fodinibius salinus]